MPGCWQLLPEAQTQVTDRAGILQALPGLTRGPPSPLRPPDEGRGGGGMGLFRAHQGGLEGIVLKQTGLPLPSCMGPPFHFSLWKEGSRGGWRRAAVAPAPTSACQQAAQKKQIWIGRRGREGSENAEGSPQGGDPGAGAGVSYPHSKLRAGDSFLRRLYEIRGLPAQPAAASLGTVRMGMVVLPQGRPIQLS